MNRISRLHLVTTEDPTAFTQTSPSPNTSFDGTSQRPQQQDRNSDPAYIAERKAKERTRPGRKAAYRERRAKRDTKKKRLVKTRPSISKGDTQQKIDKRKQQHDLLDQLEMIPADEDLPPFTTTTSSSSMVPSNNTPTKNQTNVTNITTPIFSPLTPTVLHMPVSDVYAAMQSIYEYRLNQLKKTRILSPGRSDVFF
ncbi:unnamed protein product [Rhizophagus irregularis]|nr:unnamed protein product [Rhizophagus irregularis]